MSAAINPTLVEGQIQGGVAQDLGWPLIGGIPSRPHRELHDYLIRVATCPTSECILIEDREPLGPSGAPRASRAWPGADRARHPGPVHHATGVRATRVSAAAHRLAKRSLTCPPALRLPLRRAAGERWGPLRSNGR